MTKFNVTNHALDRWRERCAAYADETVYDLMTAIRESERVTDPAAHKLIFTPNTVYFHHKSRGCYFVVENLDQDCGRVVTVIVPGQEMVRLVPKKKVKPVAVVVDVAPEPPPPAKPPPGPDYAKIMLLQNAIIDARNAAAELRAERPVFSNIGERRTWIGREIKRLEGVLADNRGGSFESAIKQYLTDLNNEARELRPAYKAWRAAEDAKYENEIIRPLDGSINFTAAIKFLLAKVDEQERRIAELEATITTEKHI